MRYTVRLFAGIKEHAGRETIDIELPAPTTAGALREALTRCLPPSRDLLAHSLIARNHAVVPDSEFLDPCDELAIIPPVSGG